MIIPRSFRRTIRAAHLKLVYSRADYDKSLKNLEKAVTKVSAAITPLYPPPLPVVKSPPKLTVVKPAPLQGEDLDVSNKPLSRDPSDTQQEVNGCKGLLLEIIRRAAYDWVLYRTSRRLLNKRLADHAYRWLFQENDKHPDWAERQESGKYITSFESICFELDLDPEMVRGHIRRLTPKNVMSVGRPPEYRRREPQHHGIEENPVSLSDRDYDPTWGSITDDDGGNNFDD